MELPRALRAALDGELASLPAKRLAAVAAELSQRYRTGTPASGGKFARTREEIAAYAAVRLPATFAATYAALAQLQDRLPDWTPQTLLDAGAGPGTAMWAAATLWPDLRHITLLEREEGMIALGKRLAAAAPLPAIEHATWLKVDLTGRWELSPHDLVIAAYLLGELPQEQQATLIQRLWACTSGALVIIEPGTPAGFSRMKQARAHLLAAGARTIAPCPHDTPCPIPENDWCHFAQRIARSRLHRQAKAGELAYEDEKFSFAGMARLPGAAIHGRIIRHPQIRPGHIHFELCTPQGLTSTVVTRKQRALWARARDLHWGEVMPASDNEEIRR